MKKADMKLLLELSANEVRKQAGRAALYKRQSERSARNFAEAREEIGALERARAAATAQISELLTRVEND